MKAAIAFALLAMACHGDADRRLELVYDVDLDRVVDDWADQARRELVEELGDSAKSITISATGSLQVVPSGATPRDQVRDTIEQAFRDAITWRPCDSDDRALCFAASDAQTATMKQAALAQAAKTVEERLVASKHGRATARAQGQQIVIQLPVIDGDELEDVRSLISRKGRVELKVVDDGSDYMKRVYKRISSDPGASSATIGAEVDQWTSEDGSRHTDYYLVAADKSAIERYVAELAVADPVFKVPDDRELGFERIEPQQPGDQVKWRSYYLERTASLTGAAIADARAASDPTTNRPIVSVELGRYGTRVFAELTERIVGKKLATIVDGRISSVPVVQTPIRGGRLVITMGGADQARMKQDATELAVVFQTGSLPSPLVLASQHIVP